MATIYAGGYQKPPKPSSLAAAAAGDPFGLTSGRNSFFGPYGNTGSASAAAQGYSTVGPAQAGQAGSLNVKAPAGVTPTTPGTGGTAAPTAPTAPAFSYDIITDVGYQAAESLLGLNNEQAQAGAHQTDPRLPPRLRRPEPRRPVVVGRRLRARASCRAEPDLDRLPAEEPVHDRPRITRSAAEPAEPRL